MIPLTSKAKSEEICRDHAYVPCKNQCTQGGRPSLCLRALGLWLHGATMVTNHHFWTEILSMLWITQWFIIPAQRSPPAKKRGGGVEILKMLAIFPRSFGQRFCELLMSGAPGPVTGCCLLCVCVLSCLAGKADFSASYKAVLSSWFQILGPLEPLPQLGRSSNSAQKLQRLLWRPGVSSRGSLG